MNNSPINTKNFVFWWGSDETGYLLSVELHRTKQKIFISAGGYHPGSHMAPGFGWQNEFEINDIAFSDLNIFLEKNNSVFKFISEHQDENTAQETILKMFEYINSKQPIPWTDAKEAIEEYKKQYYNCQRQLGEEHPDTLSALNNLALNYKQYSLYNDAIMAYEKLYNISCCTLGKEHNDTIITLRNLADTYEASGRLENAVDLYEELYQFYCEHCEEYRCILDVARSLSLIYYKLGRFKKHVEYSEKIYLLTLDNLGNDCRITVDSLNNLADAYRYSEDYPNALKANEKAYEISCHAQGNDHPQTIYVLERRAIIYSAQNNTKKELDLRKKVYELHSKIYGQEHNSTLASLYKLASTYEKLGDYNQALELYENIHKLRCLINGEMHFETLAINDEINRLKRLMTLFTHRGDSIFSGSVESREYAAKMKTEELNKSLTKKVIDDAKNKEYRAAKFYCKCEKCKKKPIWATMSYITINLFLYGAFMISLFSLLALIEGDFDEFVEDFLPYIAILLGAALLLKLGTIIHAAILQKKIKKIDEQYLPIIHTNQE